MNVNDHKHHETCHFAGKTFGETHGSPSHCSCPVLVLDGPDRLRVEGGMEIPS